MQFDSAFEEYTKHIRKRLKFFELDGDESVSNGEQTSHLTPLNIAPTPSALCSFVLYNSSSEVIIVRLLSSRVLNRHSLRRLLLLQLLIFI